MDKTEKYLKNLIGDENVVVAVSGGPDSMVLLTILSNITKKIIVAHINHKVRVESDDEYLMVKNYTEKLGLTFEGTCIENYSGDNFHRDARNFRYSFFEKLIDKHNAKYLFTAHHGDDLMETILMRIARGSTLKGYAGFKKETRLKNYTIVRPLITFSKEELLNRAKENNIPYAIDASNDKDKYTRNRYRKYITPFLKAENPNVIDKFNCFSNTLLEYQEFVHEQASQFKEKLYKENTLKIKEIYDLDIVLKKEIINLILEEIYQEDLYLVNKEHVLAILDLVASDKPNAFICLPKTIMVTRDYDLLVFKKGKKSEEYNYELENKIVLPNGKTIEKIFESDDFSNFTLHLSSAEIKLPLFVRTRKKGDKIEVKNLNGHKKVKDVFIDEKISAGKRDEWPLLVDKSGTIIWIPGLKKSKLDKTNNEKYDIILKYY